MATKKEAEKVEKAANYEVKAHFVTGGGVTYGPLTKSEANDMADEICADGCNKDGTYYPAHQILKVKVYQVQ